MKKYVLAAISCCMILVCSGCGVQDSPPPATEQENAVLETTELGEDEYYLLKTESDLQAIGVTYPLSGNYVLANDITLSEEWRPIGSSEAPFTGVFDGNGFCIKNLTVTNKSDEMGFFGAAKDANIKNLVLEDAHIDVLMFFPIVSKAENTEITNCSVNNPN